MDSAAEVLKVGGHVLLKSMKYGIYGNVSKKSTEGT